MKHNKTSRPLELDEATCIFGAGVLLKHLQALADEVEGVQAGLPDIEYIHRARVASRRLRAALPLFLTCLPPKKTRRWIKQIREVTRALGEARDVDVQLDLVETFNAQLDDRSRKPGTVRLALRLRQKRAGIQPAVTRAMRRLTTSNLIPELKVRLEALVQRDQDVYIYTPVLYQHSFQSIHSQLESFLAYDAIVAHPEMITELHEMRIHAKRLRYTLETFSGLYANQLKPSLAVVRSAQDLLGDIHDCDIWQDFLPRFLEEERARIIEYYGHERPYKRLAPGILAMREDRQQKRAALHQEFTGFWQQWQEEKIWSELRATIQVPFLRADTVYPPANREEELSKSGSDALEG